MPRRPNLAVDIRVPVRVDVPAGQQLAVEAGEDVVAFGPTVVAAQQQQRPEPRTLIRRGHDHIPTMAERTATGHEGVAVLQLLSGGHDSAWYRAAFAETLTTNAPDLLVDADEPAAPKRRAKRQAAKVVPLRRKRA